MSLSAFVVAICIAIVIFVFFLGIAAWNYSRQDNLISETDDDGWILGNFDEKVYRAFFGYANPDETAKKLGIDTKKYYRSCGVTHTHPDVIKLVACFIYGFFFFILFLILGFIINMLLMSIGAFLFIYFIFYQQHKLDGIAENRRRQMENELPRFLGLLQSELSVGMPIDNAIEILCERMDGILAEEFLRAMNNMKIGASSWQGALIDMATRYEIPTLSDFVQDVITSYNNGVPMTDTVEREVAEITQKHLLNVEADAGKAENVILFPMVIFQFLPMIFFMLFPAIVQIAESFT